MDHLLSLADVRRSIWRRLFLGDARFIPRSAFMVLLGMMPFAAQPTRADSVTVFSTYSSWSAAAGGNIIDLNLTPLNTNGPPQPGPGISGYTELGPGPVSLGPVSFTATGQITHLSGPNAGLIQPNYLTAIDSLFSSSVRPLVSQTGMSSTCATGTLANPAPLFTMNCAIAIGLPSGTFAFGIYLSNVNSDPAAPFIIVLSTGETYAVSTPIGTSAFFGFISPSPVTGVSITQDPLLGPFVIENPSYAVVPEPGTLLLLGTGLISLSLARRFGWMLSSKPR